jgi:hypothetical protein
MSVATETVPAHPPLPVDPTPEQLAESFADWMDVTPVATDTQPLTTGNIALGLAGYLVLPFVGLLDSAGAGTLPTAVAPPIAALLLSVPSLIVGHQYLGLTASPRDLLADVGRVFVQTGRLCLGLVPVVGLYAATTGLGPIALALVLTGVGLVSLELARRRLIRRERAATAGDRVVTPGERVRMVLLATAWAGLALLIAGRLGLSLLSSI